MTLPEVWNSPAFDRARALHRQAGLVDLHVDSILQTRLFGYDIARAHGAPRLGQPLFWHADIPRMQQAGYGVAAMGIHWYPWESERGWREAMRQIDTLDALAARTGVQRLQGPEGLLRTSTDLGLIPGVEGAHILNGNMARVRTLAERGVLYLTLCHFSANQACSPGIGRGASDRRGLTAFGADLVDALQDLGVAVDVAHVGHQGVLDACQRARAPILCTHTGARALSDSPRLLHDDAIDAIAATGGVMGIIYGPNFLAGRLRASSEVVLDHYDYIADRVGRQHLAVGTDLDGWLPSIPNDMRDCRDVVRVTEGLLRRGWSEAEVRGVLGDNLRRALRGVVDARVHSVDPRK
jgi:membrane dipeptidase